MDKNEIEKELKRTKPDFVVYVPKSTDGFTKDTGNEHFILIQWKENLVAFWTQSTYEGMPDQRVVMSTSQDQGISWTKPFVIAGPDRNKGKYMASWQFPLVSKSGRIYLIYNRNTGINDVFKHTTGLMAGRFSDDGKTWSEEEIIHMDRSIWDNPRPEVPANWIVWQKPERISKGKYFTGFTRWISPSVCKPGPFNKWWSFASVIEFMRFENIDENPDISSIKISFFASNEKALKVGLIDHPEISVVQEPSIVKLPDGRIFCVMRTTTGNPYWSVSSDEGETWQKPQALRQYDEGPLILHPCAPCPIYEVKEGEYIMLIHNNDGAVKLRKDMHAEIYRRPVYILRGIFRKDAKQPVWFSEPVFLMDNDGVQLLRVGLSMYSSITRHKDYLTLWYPDRKFFLLKKKIFFDWLKEIPVAK